MGDSEFTLAENHRVSSMKQEVRKHTANETQRIAIPPYDRKGCGGFLSCLPLKSKDRPRFAKTALDLQSLPSICKACPQNANEACPVIAKGICPKNAKGRAETRPDALSIFLSLQEIKA